MHLRHSKTEKLHYVHFQKKLLLGEDVELFCHLNSELLLLESVCVAHDSAEVLQQGGYVRQQHTGALV